jgi:hypothetical protein
MLSQMLNKMEGVDIYVILSLLIFLALFIGASLYVWKADKIHIAKMSEMPLNESVIKNTMP